MFDDEQTVTYRPLKLEGIMELSLKQLERVAIEHLSMVISGSQ